MSSHEVGLILRSLGQNPAEAEIQAGAPLLGDQVITDHDVGHGDGGGQGWHWKHRLPRVPRHDGAEGEQSVIPLFS